MATDKITEIVDQSAFDQVVKLKTELKDLAGVFADLFKQAQSSKGILSGATTVSGTNQGVAKVTKDVTELDRVSKQLVNTHEKLAVSETRLRQALEERKVTLGKINQEIRDNTKAQLAQEGSVDQIRAKLGLLQRQYDSLGKTARESIGKDMLGNIQKLDTELKKIEGSTGRYQRNVGNYTNATFQLSQVIRELPAFTYSATTGILAMSNNLPMLADGFVQVAKSTKQVKNDLGELVNDPKGGINGVTGAIKIFGASIFSMGNIFSIAVAVITIFSKEIIDFIAGTESATEATEKFNISLEGMSQNLQQIRDDIAFSNDMIDKETKLLIAKAKARGDDEQARKLTLEAEKKGILEKISLLDFEMQKIQESRRIYNDRLRIKNVNSGAIPQSKEDLQKLLDETDKLYSESMKRRSDLLIDLQIKELDYIKPDSTKKTKSTKKGSTPKEINRIAELQKLLQDEKKILDTAYKAGELDYYNYNLKLLEISAMFADKRLTQLGNMTSEETHSLIEYKETLVDIAKEGWDGIKTSGEGALKSLKEEGKEGVKLANENVQALAKVQKLLDTNSDAVVKLSKTDLVDMKKAILDILSVADKAFGILGDWGTQVAGIIADKANSEAEQQIKNIDRVEKAQLMSLSRITMGTKEYEEAKRRIEVQAEARRQETEKKRITAIRNAAKIQKAADVASIISGTAAAIINALKTQPAALGIAYAAAAGITGGLQLARALAAPLPGYEDGTDYHPTNEPFLAGEAGAEGVILPNGKRMLVDRPTIFPAGLKGTKVINNKDLMQSVYNSALVKLATQGTVTTDKMQEALIQSLEEQAGKIDNVVKAVENLKLSVKFENFSEHINHVKQRTR